MPPVADGLPPQIWMPPRPAIIRPATDELSRYGSDPTLAAIPGLPVGLRPWIGQNNLAITAIYRLKLLGGLKLCLDAGDASSYGGSGQTWADVSGNGYDCLFGASGSAEGSDPAFVGSAGALDAYMAFDGGDWFTLGQSNPTWVNNMHKDGAAFSVLFWVYLADMGGTQVVCGTRSGFDVGFGFNIRGDFADNEQQFLVNNGSSDIFSAIGGAASAPTEDAWSLIGISFDETAGSGFFVINDSAVTISGTYSSPSSGAAAAMLQIGAQGDGVAPLLNANRMGVAAMWEGVALSEAQIVAVFNATRGRFGL